MNKSKFRINNHKLTHWATHKVSLCTLDIHTYSLYIYNILHTFLSLIFLFCSSFGLVQNYLKVQWNGATRGVKEGMRVGAGANTDEASTSSDDQVQFFLCTVVQRLRCKCDECFV